ncbi:transposase [Streptosporangium canum]|uniref:transposase n=1 Tax=Streptosporangium canum TaxID=324952 RepID=UPI003439DAB0
MIPDELWARIEPLLPVLPRRTDHPGRKRLDNRKVLSGILFVLYTGIAWEFLPQELGFGPRVTCRRRLRDWHQAGVWQKLHELLPAEPHATGKLDRSRAVIDRSHIRALKGGPKTGPSPVDRAKTGSKHHNIADGSGLGGHRWVIEQTVALLHWFRRLRIRWEIRDDIHGAFMTLAAAIICWRRLIH